ncbi:glycine cleavage system protein GcvH [Streptomyces sp. LP11]|uniref:Glycine cleavage system H protein n=1 Tax=Streptomyces pyxinicus TaxID=2970331 RepID=A0ABT2AWF8_9ACTN|nr:glycine cleavage system protein GcvH [Streptomyces sp. LP11]MCS0600582.1 glycine cleavage system protein GcvH [Streptomyces sp. LP11]
MTIPDDRMYSKDHEWVLVTGDKARVGITDYAQKQLGDVVFVELRQAGTRLDAGDPFGTVESVKSVSEVYMPVSGTIAATSSDLVDDPETVSTDPYGDGWMIEITVSDKAQLDALLSAAEYEKYIKDAE